MKRVVIISLLLLLATLTATAQVQPAPKRVLTNYIPPAGSGFEVRIDMSNPTGTPVSVTLSTPNGSWLSTVQVGPTAAWSELIPSDAAPGPIVATGGEGLNIEVFIQGGGFGTFVPPPTPGRNNGWSIIGAGQGYYSLALYTDVEATVEIIGYCWEGEELWRLPLTLTPGQVWGQELQYADSFVVTSNARIYAPELITIRPDGMAVHYGVPLP